MSENTCDGGGLCAHVQRDDTPANSRSDKKKRVREVVRTVIVDVTMIWAVYSCYTGAMSVHGCIATFFALLVINIGASKMGY